MYILCVSRPFRQKSLLCIIDKHKKKHLKFYFFWNIKFNSSWYYMSKLDKCIQFIFSQVKILTMYGWCEENQTSTAVPRSHCSRNDNSLAQWTSRPRKHCRLRLATEFNEKTTSWSITHTMHKCSRNDINRSMNPLIERSSSQSIFWTLPSDTVREYYSE